MARLNSTTSRHERVNTAALAEESSDPPDPLLDALIKFNKAGHSLAELWEIDNGRHPIDTCQGYPFPQSFDEIMTGVQAWTEAALNKKCEEKLCRQKGQHSSRWRLGDHRCSACQNCGAIVRPSGPYFELVILKRGLKKEVSVSQFNSKRMLSAP